MFYRRGTVGADPSRYLLRSETSIPRFLEDGLYHRHLARFLEFFSRDQISVVLYDDIRGGQPETVIEAVSAHIGVKPHLASVSMRSRVKDRDAALLPLTLRRWLRPVKQFAEPWRQSPWFVAARRRLARPLDYPPLSAELRRELRDYYADDVTELGGLLGRDMSFWLATEGKEE